MAPLASSHTPLSLSLSLSHQPACPPHRIGQRGYASGVVADFDYPGSAILPKWFGERHAVHRWPEPLHKERLADCGGT